MEVSIIIRLHKGLNMLKDKLHSLIYFPYEEKYRDQLELGMVSLNYKSERVIAWVMLITQIFMILVFTFRPGSIFYSFRRLRYVIAYTQGCLCFCLSTDAPKITGGCIPDSVYLSAYCFLCGLDAFPIWMHWGM